MTRILFSIKDPVFLAMAKEELAKGDFQISFSQNREHLIADFNKCAANIVLFEVTMEDLSSCVALSRQCKKIDRNVKTLFLVDEKRESECAKNVLECKRDGMIDHFLYASISPAYFKGIMETL